MKYWEMLFAAGIGILAACSEINEIDCEKDTFLDEEDFVERVIFEAPVIRALGDDDETRASLSQTGDDAIRFAWESTDIVGIYPNKGAQVYFEMADGVGTNVASFDGGGWALRKGYTYSCYYPLVSDMFLDRNAIPVSFANQEQKGVTDYEGVRFYLASEGTSAESGTLRFTFQMLNTVIRIKAIGLPAGTYTKLTLTTDEPLFVQEGTFGFEDMSLTGKTYSNSLEVSLKDFTLSEASTVANPVLIYLTSAPVDLSGKKVTIRVHSDDGAIYGCEKTPSKAYEAGAWGGLRCEMEMVQAKKANLKFVWGSMLVFAGTNDDNTVYVNGIQQNIVDCGWYGGGSPDKSHIWFDVNLSQDRISSIDFTTTVTSGSFPTELESVEINGVEVAIVSQSCSISHENGDVYHYSLTFNSDPIPEESVPIPEAVDLGLPSGTLWASFNLGASAPEGYGDCFAWGEIEPYYSSQDPLTWKAGKEDGYYWSSYKWCMGDWNMMTKYCTKSDYGYNGFTDGKTVLDPEDDAAHVNLGGNWRMPTDTEWTELIENCTWAWTTQNGIAGKLVTASNGNSIFLPAAGHRYFTDLFYDEGSDCNYWSSSLRTDGPNSAWYADLSSGGVNWYLFSRYDGFSIRPVSNECKWISLSEDILGPYDDYDDGYGMKVLRNKFYVKKLRIDTRYEGVDWWGIVMCFYSDDDSHFAAHWNQNGSELYYSFHVANSGHEVVDGLNDYGTEIADGVVEIDFSQYSDRVYIWGYQMNLHLSTMQAFGEFAE